MKKYLLSFSTLHKAMTVMLISPAIVFAETTQFNDISISCPNQIKLKDGYYVGVAAGYDIYKMKDTTAYSDSLTNGFFKINNDLTVNGMIGDFILGYGKLFGRNGTDYFGLELYANGSAADSDFQASVPSIPVIIDTDIIVNGSFGLSLIPGFKINNTTMLYLKLGYNWSTVSVDETIRTQHDFEFKSVEYHDEITMGGFLYGIGIESAFYDMFSMRAEYSHTSYNSFYTGSDARIGSSRNQFVLGLVYRFAQ